MAQRSNHIRTEQKPSFNGKDHLKVLLLPIGTHPQPGSYKLVSVVVLNKTA